MTAISAMSSDEARERFSEAYDDELPTEARAAFDAALAADEELAAEWAEFRALLDGTHALAAEGDPALHDDVEAHREFLEGAEEADAPDLLAGVQKKLRERSRGRYYRDRFAERGGRSAMPLFLAIVMVLVLGVAWFGLSYVELDAERSEQR